MNKLGSLALAALLIGQPGFLGAAEFAVEPFDGEPGTPISGTGSGAGWEADSTWSGPAGSSYGTNIQFIASGTNSGGVVGTSGGALAVAPGNDHARPLADTYTVGDDAGAGEHPVIYLSFLFENSSGIAPGHAFRVQLRNGTALVASFGKEINAAWRLRDSDEFADVATNYSATYFAVVKLEYDADNSQTVITGHLAEASDADLDLTDLATYPRTASLTTAGKVTFDNVNIDTNNNASVRLDEIRLGDDLANVSATPDPLLVADDPATFTTDNAPAFVDLTVANAGAGNDLVITAVTPGGTDATALSIDPLNLPLTIPPGAVDSIPVDFTPYGTYQSTYSATLEIVSNESASPRTITYQITNNPDPRIEAAATVDLSNNGVATPYSIPLSNIGINETLAISSVTVDGIDALAVSGLSFPETLDPGQDGTIDFTFTPDLGLGDYRFSLTIASTDPATPSKLIEVFITTAEPLISVDTTTLDFGQLDHNPGPVDLTVTVTNGAGTLDLNIADTTAISGSAAFSILAPALPIAVAPGASQDITVRFDPEDAEGRFSGTLTIDSDDFNGSVPTISLEALVAAPGTVVARFDFDPAQTAGAILDVDDSGGIDWTTGDLTNESLTRESGLAAGLTGNYVGFACRRQSDAQTPLDPAGSGNSTWSSFTVTPDAGGGAIDFTGGTAVIDTYAFSTLGGTTSANWTLYYSTDGGTSWNALGDSRQGAAQVGAGSTGPVGLSWDLSPIGKQTGPVGFILDPSTIGFGTNGVFGQRRVGFDNLVLTAGSVTPGGGGADFASWAAGFGIPVAPDHDASDNDGISALVEYALGLSPLVADGSPGSFDGSTLTFGKGADAVANGDVSYAIETSPDLDEWTAVTPDIDDATSISYTLPAAPGKLFARLVVTRN